MTSRNVLMAILLLTPPLSAPAALSGELAGAEPQAASPQERLYTEGTDALDARRWEKAAQAFDEAAKLEGGRTDGALYWKAYAESKLGRRAEAAAAIADLRRRFPKSRWLKDAA